MEALLREVKVQVKNRQEGSKPLGGGRGVFKKGGCQVIEFSGGSFQGKANYLYKEKVNMS
jgi:hypothetical protein